MGGFQNELYTILTAEVVEIAESFSPIPPLLTRHSGGQEQ